MDASEFIRLCRGWRLQPVNLMPIIRPERAVNIKKMKDISISGNTVFPVCASSDTIIWII
jgi:hypothetical protein